MLDLTTRFPAEIDAFFPEFATALEAKIRALEVGSNLSGPWDDLDAYIIAKCSIAHASEDFIFQIQKWARAESFDFELLLEGCTASARITGQYAYGRIKHQAGIQFVPTWPTNQTNSPKTAEVKVEIWPIWPASMLYPIPEQELEIYQIDQIHREVLGSIVHERYVRIRHLPTGTPLEANALHNVHEARHQLTLILQSRLRALRYGRYA